ncbi:MAG TPA: tail fiber protein, partial [Opitutaceae bacterium]|nr:tail fiber protein [Opitutaceae bacterium]
AIASNTALFSLLGTNYGGNGTTTYAYPNLTGRPIIGAGNGPGLTPQVVGEANGSPTHTLVTIEMPTHAHGVASGGATGPSGNGLPFDNMQPTLAMTRLIAAEGIYPTGSGGAAITIGHVATFAGNFTPYGWVPADGALYPIADYSALYSVIGTTYGGDGVNTFAVPDLRGRLSVGADSTFPLGAVFGSETTTLTGPNNGAHAHLGPGGATGITGSNLQFNNYAPSLALNYIIALSGLFPCNGCNGGFDSDTPFLGQIAEFAGNVAPDGWVFAHGQILSISANSALFSLLGTTYGGNGTTTFALPDMRGRTLVGLGTSYPSGAMAGTGTQQINSSNLPPHVHLSPPFEPTIGTATASPGQASVTFAAPSNTGGATITGYTVTSSPGGLTGSGATSPIVVTGLNNGTSYTFSVKATNALGAGAPSSASNSVTPFVPSAPDAPTIGLATGGNASASIAFTAPAFDGGSPIIGYTATCSPGLATASNTASPIVVGGLANGTAHTCTVTATNAIGTSAPSAASNAITPIAPQAITFNNPGAQNFGTTPTLTATASSTLTVTLASSTTGVCTISSGGLLTFVAAGTCTIRANQGGNAAFLAAPQVSQSFAVNAVAPGAPTIGVATAGNTQASITFTSPASSGGAAITAYTMTANPGGVSAGGAASPITVAGLTNGIAYTFTVTATNSAGTGAASAASNSVTPKGAQTITFANPGAQNFGTTPTLTATASSALTVTFTSSTPGVCTISAGGAITFVTVGTCTINADQPGNGSFLAATRVSQSFTVNATVPGAPTIGVATAGNTQATVAFTAPASNGGAAITGYTVTASPGGATGTGGGSPITVAGLTNGVAYTFTVTATNSAGTGLASAASNSVTPKAAQTITFAQPSPQNIGTTPTLLATASSALSVAFTSATPGVCTITAGGVLTLVASGTCTINADQAGSAAFLPAPQVSRSFTVNTPSYTVTPSAGANGAISPDTAQTVPDGGTTTFTLAPGAGFRSNVAGTCGGNLVGNTYTTNAIRAHCTVIATFSPLTDIPRLANISTRMQVLTGADVMIGGFIIGGDSNKTVVVRARGPSLVPFGVSNPLANPALRLVRSSDQATLATNDDFGTAANVADLVASGFAPTDPLEAAILVSLPPGAYTAVVSGADGGIGVGIVEVFEVDHPEYPLVNSSTRGQVLTGNDVMIGGFVVQGAAPQTVVLRARGPSLAPFGITNALANPRLQLVRSSDQTTVAMNDDWQTAVNAADLLASGFAPSDPLEAALLITLDPGAYTVIVSGVGGGTGVAIVEIFDN